MLSFDDHKLWLCLDEKIDYSKDVSKDIHHLVNILAEECFKYVILSTFLHSSSNTIYVIERRNWSHYNLVCSFRKTSGLKEVLACLWRHD